MYIYIFTYIYIHVFIYIFFRYVFIYGDLTCKHVDLTNNNGDLWDILWEYQYRFHQDMHHFLTHPLDI